MIKENKLLADLNSQIDSIDSDILLLLARRFEIIKGLMVARNLSEDQISFNPSQEAIIIRSLIQKNNGVLSTKALIKIWREIISAGDRLHRDFSVAVYTKERAHEMTELARDHFGITGKYIPCLSVGQAFRKMDMNEAQIAVLPLFENAQESWWTALTSTEHRNVKIVGKLPFVKTRDEMREKEAFIVSAVDIHPTGNDRTFLAIEMSSYTSIDALKKMLEGCHLSVCHIWPVNNLVRVYLFAVEVEGFIRLDDKKILAFQEKYTKNIQMIRSIGGYAVQELLEEA